MAACFGAFPLDQKMVATGGTGKCLRKRLNVCSFLSRRLFHVFSFTKNHDEAESALIISIYVLPPASEILIVVKKCMFSVGSFYYGSSIRAVFFTIRAWTPIDYAVFKGVFIFHIKKRTTYPIKCSNKFIENDLQCSK